MKHNYETGKYPWDQKSDESPKAWEAFCVYRDMGPGRTYKAVAEHLGKSDPLINRWGSQHDWQERVRQYDAWYQRERDLKSIDNETRMQVTVLQGALTDYAKARKIWNNALDQLTPELEAGDKKAIRVFNQLIQSRKQLDDMARRSVRLPSSYGREEVPQDEEPEGKYIITIDGTEALGDGD